MALNLTTRISFVFLGAAALLCGRAMAAANPTGDAEKGKTVFARCAMCHSLEPGVNKVGPSLAGVIGQKAGRVPGFNFSAAMAGSNITWSYDNLDRFLANPPAAVPGTKMTFAGLASPTDRANVIAYIARPAK